MSGTKHCPARKVGTILTAVCLVVVLAFAVNNLIDTKDAKLQANLLVAQARALKAEADRQEVLDVLAGNLVMTEPIGSMAKVATVKWELVSMEK